MVRLLTDGTLLNQIGRGSHLDGDPPRPAGEEASVIGSRVECRSAPARGRGRPGDGRGPRL